jgi:hypothetical protein
VLRWGCGNESHLSALAPHDSLPPTGDRNEDIVSVKQGIDSRVTELANRIRAAQGPQIQQMQDWLNHWGNPPMPETAPGGMPGMLSSEYWTR